MEDFEGYLQKMEKALADKLFFLQLVDLSEFDIVLDFGCANGVLLKKCAEKYSCVDFFGYDNSTMMIENARNTNDFKNAHFYSNLTEVLPKLENKKYLIIFSSVLHEVNKDDHESILNLMQNSHAVVIRDMFFDRLQNKPLDCSNILQSKKGNIYLKQFEEKYGKIDNLLNLYHYFLKYTYTQNWQTELLENYFSIDYDYIIEFLKSNGFEIFYDEKFVLPFKQTEVKQNFDFDLNLPTHRKLILKRQ